MVQLGVSAPYTKKPPEFVFDYAGQGYHPQLNTAQERGLAHYGYWAISEGRMFGHYGVVTPDRRLSLDRGIGSYEWFFQNEITKAGWVRHDFELLDGCRLASKRLVSPDVRIEEDLLIITSGEPVGYHAMFYQLFPKAVTILEHGLEGKVFVPLCRGQLGNLISDLLNLAGIPSDRIIDHDFSKTYIARHVKQLLLRFNDTYFDPSVLNFIHDMVKRAGVQREQRDLIYMSRENQKLRKMNNEGELVKSLQAIGFKIVRPEFHSLREQMEIFSKARVVVAPGGANCTNALFMPKDSLFICMEGPMFQQHMRAMLLASCGVRYGFIIGQVTDEEVTHGLPPHKNWVIDVPLVTDFIRKHI
jgi:capsular polysaccharide biosynthesis protein